MSERRQNPPDRPCPRCGAPSGEPCVSAGAGAYPRGCPPLRRTHPERNRPQGPASASAPPGTAPGPSGGAEPQEGPAAALRGAGWELLADEPDRDFRDAAHDQLTTLRVQPIEPGPLRLAALLEAADQELAACLLGAALTRGHE